jgi:hypothetical protein
VGRDVGCRGTAVVVLEGMTTHAGAEKTDGRDVSGGRKEAQRRARVRARLGSTRMGHGSREWRALGDGGGDGEAMWTPTLRPYRVVDILYNRCALIFYRIFCIPLQRTGTYLVYIIPLMCSLYRGAYIYIVLICDCERDLAMKNVCTDEASGVVTK